MKKKKFLCFLLILTLCFSSTVPAYASSGGGASFGESETDSSGGSHGGGGVPIDPSEYYKDKARKFGEFVGKTALVPAEFASSATETVLQWLQDKFSDWVDRGWLHVGEDAFQLNADATQELNTYLQGQIQVFDGYYLITPKYPLTLDGFINVAGYLKNLDDLSKDNFNEAISPYNLAFAYTTGKTLLMNSNELIFYLDNSSECGILFPASYHIATIRTYSNNTFSDYDISNGWFESKRFGGSLDWFNKAIDDPHSYSGNGMFGSPFKLFYSKSYANRYKDKGRSYIPVYPSTGFSIPTKYIDNPSLLPDITYNIDKSNKTEEIIQNEYNTIINNYITSLGGSSGGDSGDTGGGSGGGNITDTELYDFLTKLWNESDKKFDKMVDLLEQNNKYQKKLVDSLNDIKAILVTQTVFDAFKNRSSETANKAKEKFPTSIPWDVAMVLNAMSAEPQELKFSLPIQVKSFGINESINIDLSSEEWSKLAKTCRYLLSITFILILIQLTRKLFSSGGDD